MGIVYNGMYLTYFEVGRTELMRSVGLPYSEFEKEGYWLPLVEARVFYKSPAHYDDLLEVEAVLVLEEKATIKFEYNVNCNGSTLAKGYTVHSFLNALTRKPVRPPAVFLKKVGKVPN
jgi:acyl-CoA thioester hydrolase